MNTLLIFLTVWALVSLVIFVMSSFDLVNSIYDIPGLFIASSVFSFIISVLLFSMGFLFKVLQRLLEVV